MTFRSVIDLLELLDDGRTTGAQVAEYLSALGSAKVSVKRVEGDKPGTFTDFIRCEIAGTRGKISGGSAPHSASSGGLAASAPVRPAKVLFRTATAHSPRWLPPQSSSKCSRAATGLRETSS